MDSKMKMIDPSFMVYVSIGFLIIFNMEVGYVMFTTKMRLENSASYLIILSEIYFIVLVWLSFLDIQSDTKWY